MVFQYQAQFEYGADIVMSTGSRWVVCASLLCLAHPHVRAASMCLCGMSGRRQMERSGTQHTEWNCRWKPAVGATRRWLPTGVPHRAAQALGAGQGAGGLP